MAYLASATGKRFEEGDVKLWLNLLKDIPYPTLERAVHRYCRERREMPSVSDIRDMAAEVVSGELDESAAAFERLTKAVRKFGIYDPVGGRASLDPLTRAATESCGGWSWACDLGPDNRQTYAAQFRGAYQALAAREERHRRLPGALRPAITNGSPMVSLPAPSAPKALPAPAHEPVSAEALEKAKLLGMFRDVEEKPAGPREVDEASRQRQAEWLRSKIAEAQPPPSRAGEAGGDAA